MKNLKIIGLLAVAIVVGYVGYGKIRYALYVRNYVACTAAFEESRGRLLLQVGTNEMGKATPYGFKLHSDLKTQQVMIRLDEGYRRMPEIQQATYRQGLFDSWKSIVHSNQLKDLSAVAVIEDPYAKKAYDFDEQGSHVSDWPEFQPKNRIKNNQIGVRN